MRLPTHVTCPEGVTTRYLTPGKTYEITGWFDAPTGFYIDDDEDDALHCRTEGCGHLAKDRNLDWILTVNGKPVLAERSPLDEALDLLAEAADLLDDTAHGHYTPDSFSSQPARVFLAKHGRGVQS